MKFRSFIRYTWLSLHLTQEELLSMRAWRWYDRVWRLRAAVTNYACSFGSNLKTMHLLQSRKLRFWLPRSCIYFDVLPLLWLEINRSHHLPMTELHMAGASIYTGTIPCSRWNNTIGFIQLDWNHSFAHVWRTVLYRERERVFGIGCGPTNVCIGYGIIRRVHGYSTSSIQLRNASFVQISQESVPSFHNHQILKSVSRSVWVGTDKQQQPWVVVNRMVQHWNGNGNRSKRAMIYAPAVNTKVKTDSRRSAHTCYSCRYIRCWITEVSTS